MKKIGLLITPVVAISFLVSCGGGKDSIRHTLKFEGTHCEMYDKEGKPVTQKSFEAGQTASFYLAGSPSEDFGIPKKDNVKFTVTGTEDPFDGTYAYNEEDGSISIKMTADVTVTALSDLLWYRDTEYIKSLTAADITKEGGEIKTIKVNGLDHKVRLIGVDEDCTDITKPDETKIHTTWEFVDLLSDENGYSLATYWNDTATTTDSNHDYESSTIREVLNGGGGDINWFRFYGLLDGDENPKNLKFAEEKNYKIPVLSMLPDGLVSVLKTPSKYTNIYDRDWADKTITDKLFLLSPKEMGYSGEGQETKTDTYSYYKDHPEAVDAIRIKKQVKGLDGARTTYLNGTDLDGKYSGGVKYSYAGYNNGTETLGSNYWLRSPKINESTDEYSWMWDDMQSGGAKFAHRSVYSRALGIAPAFCI